MVNYTAKRSGNKVTVYAQAIPDVGPDADRTDLSSHPATIVAVFEGPAGNLRKVSGETSERIIEAAYSV